MGFRAPLDGEQYARNLGGDGLRALGYRATGVHEARIPVGEAEDRISRNVDISKPFKRGAGPAEASTCTALDITPPVIWDVNHYYRRLGIPFPYRDITRAQLREAFHRVGGERYVEITYAFKQLLNQAVRYDYDRAPWGQPFFDDYLDELLKQEARREAARRQVAAGGASVTAGDVLEDWGLHLVDEQVQDADTEPEAAPEPVERVWSWSYYLWRSVCDDRERLGRWQAALVAEFSRLGISRTIAVGYFGKQPHSWVSVDAGNTKAILLHENVEPTQQMAAQAAAYVYDTTPD